MCIAGALDLTGSRMRRAGSARLTTSKLLLQVGRALRCAPEIKKKIRAFPRKCGILAAISCTVHWAMSRLRQVRAARLGGTLTCG